MDKPTKKQLSFWFNNYSDYYYEILEWYKINDYDYFKSVIFPVYKRNLFSIPSLYLLNSKFKYIFAAVLTLVLLFPPVTTTPPESDEYIMGIGDVWIINGYYYSLGYYKPVTSFNFITNALSKEEVKILPEYKVVATNTIYKYRKEVNRETVKIEFDRTIKGPFWMIEVLIIICLYIFICFVRHKYDAHVFTKNAHNKLKSA